MSTELAKTLEQLHIQLANNPAVDQKTMASLLLLASDIREIIEQQTRASEIGTAQEAGDRTLSDRIQTLLDQFEASHPQLTKTLSMIAERLADMGI